MEDATPRITGNFDEHPMANIIDRLPPPGRRLKPRGALMLIAAVRSGALTLDEAAERYGVSPKALRRWCTSEADLEGSAMKIDPAAGP
jgi:hypothetical protein